MVPPPPLLSDGTAAEIEQQQHQQQQQWLHPPSFQSAALEDLNCVTVKYYQTAA